jgi:hypothetical protein
LKLIRSARAMRRTLRIVGNCLVALYNIAFLLLLFCYVFRCALGELSLCAWL